MHSFPTHPDRIWPRFVGALLVTIAILAPSMARAQAPQPGPEPLNFLRAPGPVTIDGKLDDWLLTAPVTYEVDPNAADEKVKTYAMWDDDNIYLAYVVTDASPMKNAGDDPSAAFKAGDCLHFYLSTSDTPATTDPNGGPQDYHVLMTIQQGKPVIFAFRQKKAGTTTPNRISSPATHIDLDWMGSVPGAEMAVVTTGNAYTAEVKLPLAFFDGFHPDAGRNVATDVAVDFSDPAGTKNLAKVWWSAGATEILDIPTELQFRRNLWGTGIFRGAGDQPIVTDASNFYAEPAPGPITVDGDLSDWNLSAPYGPLYVDPQLKDQYNITWAVNYDAQALYVAAIYKSATPFDNGGGINNIWWQGDSIEFRVDLDPNHTGGDIKENPDILTFGLWYNAKENKDYLALQRSFKFHISDDSACTIRSKEIPGGRNFEVRIPWSMVKPEDVPKPGDTVRVTMAGIWKNGLRAFGMGSLSSFRGMDDWGQLHFLPAAPKLVYVNIHQPVAANVEAPPKTTTTIQVASKGLLSAGIYNPDGTLLRTLFAGKSVDPGPVTVGWDGNDDNGAPAAPGTYAVRAVLNAGLHAQWVISVANPGHPVHDSTNPRGGWGGVWDNVTAIASDATGIYPLWGGEEGDGLLIHADEDGNIIWRQHRPLAEPYRAIGVASNGKYVYVLGGQLNANTPLTSAALWRVNASDGSYAPIPHPGSDPLAFTLPNTGVSTAIAADATALYLSDAGNNAVELFDAESLAPIKSCPVPNPLGLCVAGPHELLVISGNQVLRLNTQTGATKPVISQGLSAPYGITLDLKGRILVTDRGANQQLLRFTPKGKLEGSFGVPGGRDNNGKFLVDHLLNPAGVTVAASGKVFYTEDASPRDFVRLSDALQYEKLWSGPWYLSGEVCVDPYDPSEVYIWTGNNYVRHHVDYATGTYTPDAVWTDFAIQKYGRWFPRIVMHDGVKYMFCAGVPTTLYRIDGDKMLLIAAVGIDRTTRVPSVWTFTDLNENGKVDPGEMNTVPPAADPNLNFHGSYNGGSVDDDLNLYLLSGDSSVIVLSPTFPKPGVPVYSFANARVIPLDAAKKIGKRDELPSIWQAPDGGVFGNSQAQGSDPHGIGHSSHLSDVFIYRLDKNGKLIWRAGKKASGLAKNGEFYGRAVGLGGPIGTDYFDFVDEGGQEKIFTTDGLFVGNLLEDNVLVPPSEYTLRVEHFNSIVYQNQLDKNWYFVAGASGYASIWQIAGLDTISRLTGELTLK